MIFLWSTTATRDLYYPRPMHQVLEVIKDYQKNKSVKNMRYNKAWEEVTLEGRWFRLTATVEPSGSGARVVIHTFSKLRLNFPETYTKGFTLYLNNKLT